MQGTQLTLIDHELLSPSAFQSCAELIAMHVRSGALAEHPVNVLVCAFQLRELLQNAVPIRNAKWHVTTTPKYSEADSPGLAKLSISSKERSIRWDGLLRLIQTSNGVDVTIPGSSMGAPNATFTFSSREQFEATLPTLVERAKAALAGRAAFRERPLQASHVASRIVSWLGKTKTIQGKLVTTSCNEDAFPWTFPSVAIARKDAIGEHVCVTCAESSNGVTVYAADYVITVTDLSSLERCFPELLEAIKRGQARLTPDKLVPKQIYEVIAPVEYRKAQLPPGTKMTFIKTVNVWHEGYDDFLFKTDNPAFRELELSGGWSADVTLINTLSQWLKPIPKD